MKEMTTKMLRFLSRMGARGVLGEVIIDKANRGDDFFAVSADLAHAAGFDRLIRKYPEKFVEIGIAEQNLIGIAAGLSSDGTPVVATTWAMFASLRCTDQLRNFLGYMRRNIKLIGMDSGLSQTRYSYSHGNPQDIAVLRTIPNITVLSPCDGVETYLAIWSALEFDGPVYIRLTGEEMLPIVHKAYNFDFNIGKSIPLKKGHDIAIVGCGAILSEVLKAVDILEKEGISCTVIDMHTIKPLDTEMLDTLTGYKLIITVEEHSILGGMGSAVAEYMADKKNSPAVLRLGIADVFTKAGSFAYGLQQYGLTAPQIAESIRAKLEE